MASLSFLFPLLDYWRQLSDGTRDGIVSSLVAAFVLGAIAVFRQSLLAGLRRLLGSNPPSLQELTIKVESVPPAAALPPAPAVPPAKAYPTPDIPRPPVTGFVARRDSDGHDIVERLKDELAPEKNQLIVLWGAGGVGKTTLAAETARLLSSVFAGRIIWISAEGRADFSLSTLLDDIATCLGRADLRPLALERKDTEVHDALANSPLTLIVLDNFETISPEEQAQCTTWLAKRANCPTLITSRDEAPHARPVHILAMSLLEAQEFLRKLIAQVRNPRAFAELNHERIIQAADRIPLVLQWVVKRIDSAKQPQAVLDELAHGEGDAAKRVFDRSFDLPQVGDDGRATLLALSLFVPSASRTALGMVAGLDSDVGRLDQAVQALVELRLIEATEGNERLSVEGLTRELAKARLTREPRANELRQRFVNYFREYSRANAEPTPEDYEALETEKDNLLSAMDVAFDMQDWSTVQGIAYALALPGSGMLSVHGYWDEAIKRNQQALGAARKLSSETDISHFAHNSAMIHQDRGEIGEARQLYEESLEIDKRLGEQSGIAISLHQLAWLAQGQGELDEARRLYNESLEINKRLGNQSGIANTLHQLAMLVQNQGELDEARRLYNESLETNKRLGNQSGIANTLHNLAAIAQDRGELDEARRLYNESLEINKRLGNQRGIASGLHHFAMLAEDQGERDEARRFYNESLEITKSLGEQRVIASSLHQLARLAQDEGELDEARRLYNESLKIKKSLGDQRGIASSLWGLGQLAEDEGGYAEAAQLLSEALPIFEKLKSPNVEIVRRDLERVKGKSD